jgi:hypothetical protein
MEGRATLQDSAMWWSSSKERLSSPRKDFPTQRETHHCVLSEGSSMCTHVPIRYATWNPELGPAGPIWQCYITRAMADQGVLHTVRTLRWFSYEPNVDFLGVGFLHIRTKRTYGLRKGSVLDLDSARHLPYIPSLGLFTLSEGIYWDMWSGDLYSSILPDLWPQFQG